MDSIKKIISDLNSRNIEQESMDWEDDLSEIAEEVGLTFIRGGLDVKRYRHHETSMAVFKVVETTYKKRK